MKKLVPEVSIQAPSITCIGSIINLEADIVGSFDSILWSTGENTTSISTLLEVPSNFEITVSNENCSTTTSVTVETFEEINWAVAVEDSILCFGELGSLEVQGFPSNVEWVEENIFSSSLDNISAGTYTAIITDQNGCTSEVVGILTEPENLMIMDLMTNNENSSNKDGSISGMIVGGIPPYTIRLDSDVLTIDENESFEFTGLSMGEYDIEIIDANGCQFSETNIMVDMSSAVNNINNFHNFHVFPNPSSDKVFISSDGLLTQSLKVSVVTTLGQVVENITTNKLDNNLLELSFVENITGVFFVKIEQEKRIWIKKIILQ